MTRVPFVDLRAQHAALSAELSEAVGCVLSSGRAILGPEVEAFENAMRIRLRVREAIGVSSGSDALLSTLMALGVGAGDEVVTTPFSFVATGEAVLRVGASLRFADVERTTLNMDPAEVERVITPRTRAILVVHLYGRSARLDRLLDLASKRGIPLVEDAAQAFGSSYRERPLGTWGSAGCFSFFPTKVLGAAGDAGLVVTNDSALGASVKRIRQHGAEEKGRYACLGGNFRLDAIQAAVLAVKSRHVDRWIGERRAHASAYDEAFRDLSGVSFLEDAPESTWNAAIYALRVHEGRREALRAHLDRAGIETAVYYDVPLHRQPALARPSHGPAAFPECERASREVLSLPLYPELREVERSRVIDAVRRFFR